MISGTMNQSRDRGVSNARKSRSGLQFLRLNSQTDLTVPDDKEVKIIRK